MCSIRIFQQLRSTSLRSRGAVRAHPVVRPRRRRRRRRRRLPCRRRPRPPVHQSPGRAPRSGRPSNPAAIPRRSTVPYACEECTPLPGVCRRDGSVYWPSTRTSGARHQIVRVRLYSRGHGQTAQEACVPRAGCDRHGVDPAVRAHDARRVVAAARPPAAHARRHVRRHARAAVRHAASADPLVPIGYEKRDTVTSLTMLLGSVAAGFVFAGAFTKADKWLFKHRVSNFGFAPRQSLTAMVLWDFLYYWDHRWMHEVRCCGPTTSPTTRASATTCRPRCASRGRGFLTFWVFAPMPLLGFPTAKTAKAGQLNLLYQYWIHTEAIDRLPAPSRRCSTRRRTTAVHHGANHAVPRQELRRHPDRLGQAVRHVRARAAPRQVRPDQEHPHLQPAAHRLPRDGRHRPRRAPLRVAYAKACAPSSARPGGRRAAIPSSWLARTHVTMAEFTDRVVLVTGSSSGIGEQIARRFAELGASVVVNSSTSVAAGEQLAGRTRGTGGVRAGRHRRP